MSSGDGGPTNPLKAETLLVTAGRDTKAQKGFVNPPVVHASTVLYPTAVALEGPSRRIPVWPAGSGLEMAHWLAATFSRHRDAADHVGPKVLARPQNKDW